MIEREHREHRRFQVRVPVYISTRGRVFRKTIHLESSDVSAGGLAFETSSRIPLAAQTRVVVAKLGDLAGSASIEACVAYRKRNPATGRYTVGLQFTRLVNVTPQELMARIEAWAAAQAAVPRA